MTLNSRLSRQKESSSQCVCVLFLSIIQKAFIANLCQQWWADENDQRHSNGACAPQQPEIGSQIAKHREASFTLSDAGFITIEINPVNSSPNTETASNYQTEALRCECLEAVPAVRCSVQAPSVWLLSLCFSHLSILSVPFLHAWYMKDFSRTPHPLGLLLPHPSPRHSEVASCSCYFVFVSFSQVFHVVATLLYQLSEPEAETLPPKKPALRLHPSASFCLSLSQPLKSTSPFGFASPLTPVSSQFVPLSGPVNGACQCD